MRKILVTYSTMAGSTASVAEVVAEEIANNGLEVELLPLSQVESVGSYDGVVVGGPMILGWHRSARRFLKQQRSAFEEVPLAVFATAMSLTDTGETAVGGVPVFVDEKLPKRAVEPGRLSMRERYATVASYVQPMLKAARPAEPVSVAFFGGRLEYGRLPWWAVLFVMLVIQAPAGDRRNWPAIRAWAAELPAAFARQ